MELSLGTGQFWFAYLTAAAVFYTIFWKLSHRPRPSYLLYGVRGLLLALMLTPWYSNSQTEQLAPALMVVTLDVITQGVNAAIRAFIPLLLSVLIALGLSCVLCFIRTMKYNKNRKNQR